MTSVLNSSFAFMRALTKSGLSVSFALAAMTAAMNEQITEERTKKHKEVIATHE